MSDIEQARDVLQRERTSVLAELQDAGAQAREAAERHKAWKVQVDELLERGRVAGVPVTEMARALGLSRQWTSHLLAQRDRALRVEKLLGGTDSPGGWRAPDA